MRKKILFSFLILIIMFGAIALKAFYLQVFNRDKLIAYSNSQILRTSKTYPRRGYILDRNGDPLAINIRKYNIFAIPKSEKLTQVELRKLVTIIPGLNYLEIRKKLKGRKKYTWVARKLKLKDSQVEKIKNLKTFFTESESSRFYPNYELASQVLGFVGVDNEGLGGIEYYFNDKLKGDLVVQKYYKDAKGRPVKFGNTDGSQNAVPDFYLSIDKDVQAAVEKYLKEGVEKHEAQSGGAGVMDVTTGEIWAMANYPTFDANQYRSSDVNNRKLAFVTNPFEPGSIFKTLTIASALENKTAKPETKYFCEKGKFKVGGHTISESDNNHVYEWISVADILKYSSNIGTTKIAFDLTFPLLKETLTKMSIGEKIGIEYPGESRGLFDRDKMNIDPLRLSNISFGQGVATTGIQMLAAYASIANGGYYIAPTFKKIENKSEVIKNQILRKDVTDQVTKMLVKAVEEGTGKNAMIPHFTIAGKTSTAQRVDENGGYKGYISGFIGYPVNVNRRFVVFVYVENPKVGGYYGNVVAAPIFHNIVKSILYKKREYNQLAHVNTENGVKSAVDYVNLRQSSSRIIAAGLAPNFMGLDKNSVSKLIEQYKFKVKMNGFGVVKEQFPAPGDEINEDTNFILKFEPPSYD